MYLYSFLCVLLVYFLTLHHRRLLICVGLRARKKNTQTFITQLARTHVQIPERVGHKWSRYASPSGTELPPTPDRPEIHSRLSGCLWQQVRQATGQAAHEATLHGFNMCTPTELLTFHPPNLRSLIALGTNLRQ